MYAVALPVIADGDPVDLLLIDNNTDDTMRFDSKHEAERVRKDFGPAYKIVPLDTE